MRRLATAAAILALSAPIFAGALSTADLTAQINALLQQITALQNQMQALQVPPVPQLSSSPASVTTTSTANPAQCTFSRTLSLGSSGSDVLALQQYLTAVGMLGGITSAGNFDDATQLALQHWQASHGVVSSGTPETTGYGVLGPRTRALVALNCPLALSPSGGRASCPVAPQPTNSCVGTWSPVATADGCTTGWQCTVPLGSLQQNACSNAIAITCPTGTHVQTSATCAQSCVSGTLSSQQPASPLSASPQTGRATLTVTFLASDVTIDTYSMNFGDGFAGQMSIRSCAGPGSSVCTYQATHNYNESGAFTATLSSTKGGQIGTTLISVQ